MACCFMLSFLSWNIQCFSQIWNSLSVKTQIITSFQYAIWCWSLNKWQMGYETGLSAFHLLISDVSSRLCVFSTYHVIGFRDSPQAGKQSGFCCVVLQAATSSECEEIVNRIGERETTLIHSIDVLKELCQVLIINIICKIFVYFFFITTAAGFKHTEWFVWKFRSWVDWTSSEVCIRCFWAQYLYCIVIYSIY